MSRHKALIRKPKAALTGLVAAAVIASGAGFIYITAPWESPDRIQDVKPIPVTDYHPEAAPSASKGPVVVGESPDGTKIMSVEGTGGTPPTFDPAKGQFSDTGSSPVRIGPAPMAPPAANDKGAGNFAAPPGAASGSWGVAGQTGGFTWNYPFSLRQAPAGATPALGISYDSSLVDGLTSATNNQASVVGDGWSLTGTGTVRQKFGACIDQGVTNSYDLCGNKEGQSFFISFGSRSGEIIMDPTQPKEKRFKLKNDDNTKVEYLLGAANGTFDGGYWRLTDTEGTQYWFGVNRIPGWSAGKDNYSTDIVPVYALPGQPCYNSAGFSSSVCMQAFAWNLDYVVDLKGNSQGFFYTQDTNFYKSQAGTGPLRAYHRSSRLARVDYGMRAGTELSTQAPLHVNFGYTGRCSGVDCTNGSDVPENNKFACTSTQTTCENYSPTFYTDQRLQTVIPQALSVNPAGYGDLDFWTFFHGMPPTGDGTKPALWLGEIIHQGANRTSTPAGTQWITDPSTKFNGQTMQNRVWVTDGLAPLNRYRLNHITNSTGGTTAVSYMASECSPTNLPAAQETNNKRCFPQWWAPTTPYPQAAKMDYFHIYPVESVITNAGPGGNGSAGMVTNYSYEGTPAWKYPAPKYVAGTGGSRMTWSVLAGWSKVKTTVGNAATKPTTVTTYLRGLDGTPSNTTGGLRSESITTSDGIANKDSTWFAGRQIEKQTFNGDGGPLLSTTITVPWASDPTATATAALGGAQARHTGTYSVTSQTATSKSAQMRSSQQVTRYDSFGRVVSASNSGEIGITGDETCTATVYADNEAANILSKPATVQTYAGDCNGSGAPTGNLLTAARTMYDTSTAAEPATPGYVAPTKGNIGRTDAATTVSGVSVTSWKQGPALGYDALGRPTTSTDNSTGTPRTTTTAYAPASGLATTVTVTNHKGWKTTTTLDSMRGLPLAKTDINQNTSSYLYDASGRITGEWSALRPQSTTNSTPGVATSYYVSRDNPSWIRTEKLSGDDVKTTSYTIYDGLGRVRQTQRQSPGGGSIATDTWYDSRGDKSRVNNDYYLAGGPDGVLKIPSLAVPSSTEYVYDGAQRPTAIRALANDNNLLWTTQMSYTGADTVTVTGPGNEAAVTTINNLNGKTENRKNFHGPAATGPFDEAKYQYDALGRLNGMSDTAGNAWSWTFDAAGRETAANDPDAGALSTTYDTAGRTLTTTNATGAVTGFAYDDLDRIVEKTVTPAGGTAMVLERSVYDADTVTGKGQLSSSTRYNAPGLGQPVVTVVSGYNAAYQPGTTTVTLPSELGSYAGTYTTTRLFTNTGRIRQEKLPVVGAMPAETLTYAYDDFDNQGSLRNENLDRYAANTVRSHLDRITSFQQFDRNTTGTGNTTGTNENFYTWDATTGRLTDQWSTNNTRDVISDLGKTRYTYNEAGKITSRELSFSSRASSATDYQCYTYDHASRLAAVWTPAPTANTNCASAPTAASTNVPGLGGAAPYAQTYTYTPAGDRSQVKRFDATGALAVTENYTYPTVGAAGPHRVQQIVSTPATGTPVTQAFTWDSAGRLTNRADQALTYTFDGRLDTTTGTSKIPANPNPGAGAGTPVSVTPAVASVAGKRYYDASGNLIGVKDGTGTTVTLGSVTAHTSSATTPISTATCTYSFAGKTVAQRTATASGTKLTFLVGDSINTTQTMTMPTTGTGPITTLTRYTDPVGLARRANATATANNAYTTAPATTAGTGSNAANPAGFGAANGYISGLDDTVSTLTHLGARDLDPVTGIFTSPDPILNTEEQGGFTPYTYAFGDVINASDPSGLYRQPICDACESVGPAPSNPGGNDRIVEPPIPFEGTIAPAPGNSSAPSGSSYMDMINNADPESGIFNTTGTATAKDGARLGMGPLESIAFGLSLPFMLLCLTPGVLICAAGTFAGGGGQIAGRAADGKSVDLSKDGAMLGAETAAGLLPPCKLKLCTPLLTRFVANSAGETLDFARVTIPEGKFGYLLENPSKSGVFSDAMGFGREELDVALRKHLFDNVGQAGPLTPMTGGGSKFTVNGPMTGPNGKTWDNIRVGWGIDPDGTVRLLTATP